MDLEAHPYFERWQDPKTGIVSHILTRRVAPLQKNFYFVNSSFSADGAWLWFEAGWPPNPMRTLAAVSLQAEDIRHFPAAGFCSESSLLAGEGRSCYFAMGTSVHEQSLDGDTRLVATVPADYIAGRQCLGISTHLTLSADGRRLLLDGPIGNRWFLATIDRFNGEFRLIREFAFHYNHSQFSPVEADLLEISQDHWRDPVSGRYTHYDHRIWLMNTSGTMFEPLDPQSLAAPHKGACHEWWAPDGTLCWIDYEKGGFECDLSTRRIDHVWKRPLCHAHCDPTRRYWVADHYPYRWDERPVQVVFFDRQTGREIEIASALPVPCWPRGAYHLDPHPRFSPRGDMIVYMTTVRGTIDVAVTRVADVLASL